MRNSGEAQVEALLCQREKKVHLFHEGRPQWSPYCSNPSVSAQGRPMGVDMGEGRKNPLLFQMLQGHGILGIIHRSAKYGEDLLRLQRCQAQVCFMHPMDWVDSDVL